MPHQGLSLVIVAFIALGLIIYRSKIPPSSFSLLLNHQLLIVATLDAYRHLKRPFSRSNIIHVDAGAQVCFQHSTPAMSADYSGILRVTIHLSYSTVPVRRSII
jgi:hypothetical protein